MTCEACVRGGEIGTIQLANAIVRQACPLADGVRSSFVPHESEREIEPQTIPRIAIVGNAHGHSLIFRRQKYGISSLTARPDLGKFSQICGMHFETVSWTIAGSGISQL